jgi:hypothetical protein
MYAIGKFNFNHVYSLAFDPITSYLYIIRCCFNILGCTVWVPVKCETKSNGTKFTETKRNEIDAKRNKSKRNSPKRNGIIQNEIKPILTKQFLGENNTKIKSLSITNHFLILLFLYFTQIL